MFMFERANIPIILNLPYVISSYHEKSRHKMTALPKKPPLNSSVINQSTHHSESDYHSFEFQIRELANYINNRLPNYMQPV